MNRSGATATNRPWPLFHLCTLVKIAPLAVDDSYGRCLEFTRKDFFGSLDARHLIGPQVTEIELNFYRINEAFFRIRVNRCVRFGENRSYGVSIPFTEGPSRRIRPFCFI